MHISEGVLSGSVLISGAALAAAGTGIGLKKLDYDQIAKAGMLSAAFFVASLIHVPIGPSNAHLILNGLVGILLGISRAVSAASSMAQSLALSPMAMSWQG